MVKFKTNNKGFITQKFANPSSIYKDRGGIHNGVDSARGWDAVTVADNDGLVYKVITSDKSSENWQGIYQLVHDRGEMYVEVVQGHFNKILVKEGDSIIEGQAWGLEGNKGYVFSGQGQITPEMQKAGDKRGAHVHTSYRPVIRVKKTKADNYYLLTIKGTKYKDGEGYYYEITHKDNGVKGNVDPFNYLYKNTIFEDMAILIKNFNLLKK